MTSIPVHIMPDEACQAETMSKLNNKIAVITGSDSGMGQAMAEQFAHEGADVATTFYRDKAGAERTEQLVNEQGRRAMVRQLDVTDESSVAALFNAVESELGIPEILVNDVGISSNSVPVAKTRTEDFDRVIKTDLYGAFFCCREFICRRGVAAARLSTLPRYTKRFQVRVMPLMARQRADC